MYLLKLASDWSLTNHRVTNHQWPFMTIKTTCISNANCVIRISKNVDTILILPGHPGNHPRYAKPDKSGTHAYSPTNCCLPYTQWPLTTHWTTAGYTHWTQKLWLMTYQLVPESYLTLAPVPEVYVGVRWEELMSLVNTNPPVLSTDLSANKQIFRKTSQSCIQYLCFIMDFFMAVFIFKGHTYILYHVQK